MDNLNGAELKVYEYLKQAITSKKLYPKFKIVEADLSDQLGVSRTPVRAALKKLSYEGLISIIPKKGAFVSAPTRDEIREVFEAKELVEIQAIGLASARITDADIATLEALLKREERMHINKDLHGFNDVNYDFHMCIARATGNRYFEKYISELTTKSNLYLVFYDKFIDTPLEESAAFREHQAIIEALKTRDFHRCREAMRLHLSTTLDGLNLQDIE